MDEDDDAAAAAATEQRVAAVGRAFPGASVLHVTASSTRDYPASYTQVGAGGLPAIVCLLHLTAAAAVVVHTYAAVCSADGVVFSSQQLQLCIMWPSTAHTTARLEQQWLPAVCHSSNYQ
jgi:hypothetical protein